MQVAPLLKPVMAKLPGVAWLTGPLAGDGVPPLVQLTEMVTDAKLLSEKFLWTVSVALFRVLVIVQEGVPPTVIATLAQLSDSV